MKNRNRIIYWVATSWLSLGMLSTGIVQLLQTDEEAEMMTRLGYPVYFLTIIGVWKILGVVAVLLHAVQASIPKFNAGMGLCRFFHSHVG
ncbi:MAG TPA: DoxX family protein, partial [Chitinophagaceae bacterium]|nr:DoxX family protein [Chitinophagaceae bacterium]